MSLTLWKRDMSPPSQAARMVASVLGVKLQLEDPDLFGGELKTPQFKKINPTSTIPFLKDGDFYISDSHAIILYLLDKYGGAHKEKLYPSDVRTRALVNQALFFDTGVFFRNLLNVALPTWMGESSGPTPTDIEKITEAVGVLEAWLESRPYIATNHVTIADIALGASVAAMQGILVLDGQKFPKTRDWLSRMQAEPCFKEISAPGCALLFKMLNEAWEKNKK